MARDSNDVLRQAMEFFIAGHIIEARALLTDLVRVNPQLEAGWMFLSYTMEDPAQKLDCLRQVLKNNPENEEAKLRIEQLTTKQAKPTKPEPPPLSAPSRPVEQRVSTESEEAKKPVLPFSSPVTIPSAPAMPHASPFTVDISHATDVLPVGAVEPTLPSKPATFLPIQELGSEGYGNESLSKQPVGAPEGREEAAVKLAATPAARRIKPKVHAKPALPSEEKPVKEKSSGRGCTCALTAALALLVVGVFGGWLYANGYVPFPVPSEGQGSPTVPPQHTDTPLIWTLPEQWTDTPTQTATPRPTITPTPTQTLTPTLAPPAPEIYQEMVSVEQQVMDLRGLSWSGTLAVYLIDKERANTIVEQIVQKSGYAEFIEDRQKVLAALGLIRKTFNLSAFELSGLTDYVEGFYYSPEKTIYIIEDQFNTYGKGIFSHEFDHALVFQHYPVAEVINGDPLCQKDSQRCEVIRSLVEGDATLLELEWYQEYSPGGIPPSPTENPASGDSSYAGNVPPFAEPDFMFAYDYGLKFVSYLWTIGKWAKVNEAYSNIPLSTEQVMHPEKYIRKEKPVAMDLPELGGVLGSGWKFLNADTLGEFTTYLVLGYGIDVSTNVPTGELPAFRDRALEAAAGWGGDRYEVFYNENRKQTILVAEWVWDSPKDEVEFTGSLKDVLNVRFRGGRVEHPGAECWLLGRDTACVFHTTIKTLWIMAPDMSVLDDILATFTEFS